MGVKIEKDLTHDFERVMKKENKERGEGGRLKAGMYSFHPINLGMVGGGEWF